MCVMNARNMYSNLAINKYLHTVASCWIFFNLLLFKLKKDTPHWWLRFKMVLKYRTSPSGHSSLFQNTESTTTVRQRNTKPAGTASFSSLHIRRKKKKVQLTSFLKGTRLPYIIESNPHPFYSFGGLKSQMWIRFTVVSWILEKMIEPLYVL